VLERRLIFQLMACIKGITALQQAQYHAE